MTDIITLICEILLIICFLGFVWGGYLWYMDYLWGVHIRQMKREYFQSLYKPRTASQWALLDRDGTEIARWD